MKPVQVEKQASNCRILHTTQRAHVDIIMHYVMCSFCSVPIVNSTTGGSPYSRLNKALYYKKLVKVVEKSQKW